MLQNRYPPKTRAVSDKKEKTCSARIAHRRCGPPGGIRTPGLQNRNLLRYPASPRAGIKLYALLRANVILPRRSEKSNYPLQKSEKNQRSEKSPEAAPPPPGIALRLLPNKYRFRLPAARAFPIFRQILKRHISVIDIPANRADPLRFLLLLRWGYLRLFLFRKSWNALRVASFIYF